MALRQGRNDPCFQGQHSLRRSRIVNGDELRFPITAVKRRYRKRLHSPLPPRRRRRTRPYPSRIPACDRDALVPALTTTGLRVSHYRRLARVHDDCARPAISDRLSAIQTTGVVSAAAEPPGPLSFRFPRSRRAAFEAARGRVSRSGRLMRAHACPHAEFWIGAARSNDERQDVRAAGPRCS
jgi:hypothetical protein